MRISESDIHYLQKRLLKWFSTNRRNFFWRQNTCSNYELIVSEIFLQRTKAETVTKYLPIFFKNYPTWNKLWQASESEIQLIIKPLGLYKQRGSRLFKLSQDLKKRGGIFPKVRLEIEEIPMMGQYMTNAYELFILNKRSPLLDVNMARLLQRFFGIQLRSDIRYDPDLQSLAYRIVDINKSKELNWAIIDYASMICKKNKPRCNLCIIKARCQYLG